MNPAPLYFYATPGGEQRGPVPLETLRGLVRNGTISPASPIWSEGWPEWRTVAACAQALALPVGNGGAGTASTDRVVIPPSLFDRMLVGTMKAALVAVPVVICYLAGLWYFGPHPVAYSTAKEAVRAKLKAPATAEFPRAGAAEYYTTWDGALVVRGEVDSQNTYGALLRSRWSVTIRGGQASDATLD